jgi:Rieske Fe-S protein
MSLTQLFPETSTRRRWVKQFIFGSVAALSGPAWSSRVLAEVASTGPGAGVLRLKPSAYPALAAAGGSVQLLFNSSMKPVTLNRVTMGRFVALDSVCTHSGCPVARFIVATNQMRCPCHGSRYDIEGRVFRDANGKSTEPADEDLGQFATIFDATKDLVSISIPQLALHINSISVHQEDAAGTVRLKLVFRVTYDSIYEIWYQPDLATPPVIAAYSKTARGPANQTAVGPEEEGTFTAYVDASGSKGFFSVGVRLTEV